MSISRVDVISSCATMPEATTALPAPDLVAWRSSRRGQYTTYMYQKTCQLTLGHNLESRLSHSVSTLCIA